MLAPAVVRLPPLLRALFPDADRVVKLEAETVEDLMNGLETRWPTCSSKASARVWTPGSSQGLTFTF